MGAFTYHLRKIMEKNDKKGRKSLTAQEMAVMSRQQNAGAESAEDDTLTLEDDTTASRRASGFGFFSWVGGLFSDDIAFWFHGTQIKGKDKHQVRGGPVPLFKGAVLDLTPASMEGRISGDRQEAYPWSKGGTPAKIVLTPVGSGFITEHKVDRFEMRAPKNGEVDSFSAEIGEPVSYQLGDGEKLEARGALLDQEKVTLENPRLASGREFESAVINEDGIVLADRSQEEAVVEDALQTGGGQGGTEVSQSGGGGTEEAPQGTAEVSQAGRAQEEESGEDGEGRKGTFLDLHSGAVQVDGGEEKGFRADIRTGEMNVKNGDVEASVNLIKKTFKFTVGKGWSSEDEQEDEEEDNEEDKTIKEALSAYYADFKGAKEKLGFARDAMLLFFQTGELPENKFKGEEAEEESTGERKLSAEVMLCPGISFVASLEPKWSFGFQLDFSLMDTGEATEVAVNMKNGKVVSITCPDITRMFQVKAQASGEIGATLRLALRTGIGYLFYVEGGLFAEGVARGSLGEKVFGEGTVELPITLQSASKTIKLGEAAMDLKAGIGIFGSVGGDIKAGSELFGWENELYSYTFKEWNPADFTGMVSLKHNSSKGGFFNPFSWEKTESAFEIDFFQTHIESQERFGLARPNASRINTSIDEGKTLKDKLVKIHDRLAEIERRAAPGKAGGQVAGENSAAYAGLTEELQMVSKHLGNLMVVGEMTLARIRESIAQYMAEDAYRSSSKKAQAGIEKHEGRLAKMQEWGAKEEFKDRQEARGLAAYDFYEGQFGEAGALRERKELHRETAKRSLASKDALLSYERQRIAELGKKHNDRIEALREDFDRMGAEEKNIPNKAFLQKYEALGGKAFFQTVQKYSGKEKLILYEEGRLNKYAERHRERAKDLEGKLGDIPADKRNRPNRAFAEYYYNTVNGKGFFAKDKLIYNHQNGAEIVAYEQRRLYDRAEDNMLRIQELERVKKSYDGAREEGKKEILKKAGSSYKDSAGAGRLGHFGQSDIGIASAASKQDILTYEINRLEAYRAGGGKGQKSFGAEKEALELLGAGTGTGAGGADPLAGLDDGKKKLVWDAYGEWMKEQDVKTIQEIIPLRLMLEYEKEQKEKKADSLIKKMQKKAKKAGGLSADQVMERLKQDKSYSKHEERSQDLERAVLMLEYEQDQETVEKTTEEAKKKYFEEEKAKELFQLVKNGERRDARVLRAVLERRAENLGGGHAERLGKLREFMGLAEDGMDAVTSAKSDAQVWDFYKNDLKAGGGFAEYFRKQRGGSYSIDDMLRYEQYAAREKSMSNALTSAVSRTVEAKVADYTTSEGGAALKEKREKERKGGHYDRYMALKAKLESGASDADIVQLYLSMGGGNGYVESLLEEKMFLDVVTPEEIMRYEQTHSGKKGEVHKKRLEMLQGLDTDMRDEDVYEAYRQSVLEGHAVKQFADRAGIRQKIGFDETVKVEEIATPQMIMDFETSRVAELTAKHRSREESLSGEGVTDESALSVYEEMQGGKGFFKANEENLRKKEEEIGAAHNFEDILDYELSRRDFYQKIREELNEPLKRAEEAEKELKEQMREMEADRLKLQKYLGGAGVQEAFKKPEAFGNFVEESSGKRVQDNVANGEARVESIAAQAKEAQQKAEELQERIENERLLEEDVS